MSKRLPMLEQEEFEAWLHQEPTRKFLQYLKDFRGQLKEMWAEGNFQRDRQDCYIIEDINAVARVQIFKDLIDLEYSTIYEFYHPTKSEEKNVDDNDDD
jgi:hypothetical protein